METYEQLKNEEYRQKIKALLLELPDYCTSFINSIIDKQPRTRLSYLQDLRVFFEFLRQNNPACKNVDAKNIGINILDSLTREDIVEYDSWLESYYLKDEDGKSRHYTNSAAGRKRKLSSLRSFYNFLCNTAEYINNNPTLKVAMPKVHEKEIRTLDSYELDKLLDLYDQEYKNALELYKNTPEEKRTRRIVIGPAATMRDLAICHLFLGTGLRISELVGINTLDVKWDTGRVNIVRKGGDYDHIFMPPDVLADVSNYYFNYRDVFEPFSEDDALFLSNKHCRITTRHIERKISQYIEKALGKNTGLTPHKFRATFGTNYYRKNKDIYATAGVLGHKSVETTRKSYAKPSEKAKENMKDINIRNIED